MIKGYTSGVFDLFHIGHLNLLKRAKTNCDYLIVGVCSDKLTKILKKKKPVIPLKERIEIIKALRFVDEVHEKVLDDDILACFAFKANIIFKGSDWENKDKWKHLTLNAKRFGIKTKLLSYTKGISSTKIKEKLK